MIARFINLGIATWVLVAAGAWHPPKPLFVTMLVLAFGCFAAEVAGFYKDKYRLYATACGVLLLVSGFTFRSNSDFLLWNNFFCGVAIAVLSLLRSRVPHRPWVPWSREAEEPTTP